MAGRPPSEPSKRRVHRLTINLNREEVEVLSSAFRVLKGPNVPHHMESWPGAWIRGYLIRKLQEDVARQEKRQAKRDRTE